MRASRISPLLPARGRRDRAAVPGDLRRCAIPPARTVPRRSARRRSRRGDAADEHPARHARGRARTGACTCRLRTAPLRPDRDGDERDGARRCARGRRDGGPARAQPGREADGCTRSCASRRERARQWFERGIAAGAAARQAQRAPACWRWPASTAGCSSRIEADPERALRERVSLPTAREGVGGGAQHARRERG